MESVHREPHQNGRSLSGRLLGVLGLVGILVAVAVGGWWYREPLGEWLFPERAAEKSAVEPAPNQVFALGRLEPQGEVVSVAAPSGSGGANLQTLLVTEGDAVEANQILATLDNEARLQAAVEFAESSVAQAESKLAQTRLDVSSKVDEFESVVRTAEANIASTKLKWKWRVTLAETSAVSDEEVEDARISYVLAEESLREAKARLKRYTAEWKGQPIDVQVAELELKVQQASLKQAQVNLEQAYVRAPQAGVIIDVEIQPGEELGQSALLDMGATQVMEARVEVYESDVGKLAIDQGATLYATAFDEPLTGKITEIHRVVKYQTIVKSDPAAYTDARVVEVIVRLDEASSNRAAAFVGMQVRVEFAP